tara:strand:+ start:1430 stop:2383 length:954 start_codon:yes stop_codon:yes gene_type:complete
MNQDIKHYDKIVDTNCTNYIIKLIKEKPKNWIKHFVSNNRFVNIDTNNFYAVNHYNSLYLQTFKEMNQVKSRVIGTKKQWLNKDLKVKDNATPIYLKRLLFDDDRIIGCKAYKSYFADDVENYDSLNINEDEIFKLNKYNECELFNKYISNCNVKINYHKDGIAYYRTSDHSINLPYKEQFTDDLRRSQVTAHENGHATMKPNKKFKWNGRNRDDIAKKYEFDDYKSYGFEELVAELYASFLLNSLNIELADQIHGFDKNHTAYLQSWLGSLENNTSYIKSAIKLSSDALRYTHSMQDKEVKKIIKTVKFKGINNEK